MPVLSMVRVLFSCFHVSRLFGMFVSTLPAARTARATSLPELGTILTISTSLSLRFSDRRYSVGISSVILS